MTAPQPGWIPASDLNDDEIEMMKLAGRLDPTETWVLPETGVLLKQKAEAEAAKARANPIVPKPPPGVAERIASAHAVQSSFVLADKDGKTLSASADGGAKATEAPALKVDNPDFAGKPKEPAVEFADKERFLASLLGNRPFTKTYDLFGGKLSVTFRTLTCNEQAQPGEQVWLDSNHENTMATDKQGMAEERMIRYAQYLFTAALASISVPGDVPRSFRPFDAKGNREAGILPIKEAHTKLRDEYPWPLYNALMNVHGAFCQLVGAMTVEAQNPSFWSPDAGT